MTIRGLFSAFAFFGICLLNSLFIPFWILQRIIPRNNKIWVLGAWYGNKYTDNSRSLFEYINKFEPEITAIWLSNNIEDIKYIRSLGYKAYTTKHLSGVFYSIRAGIIAYSSSKNDINKYFTNGAILINLWHAAPFKKVELGVPFAKEYQMKLKVYQYFLPWLHPYKIHHTLILSQFFSDKMVNDFGVKEDDIFITGFPRNDVFYSETPSEIVTSIKKTFKGTKIIMYMPTFRDYDWSYNYFKDFNFNKFQDYLEKTNTIFLFKKHYVSEINCDFAKYNRILDYDSYFSNQELYLHIKEMDILLTDYSSIYQDFLLLDRPIIFTPFDLSIYEKLGRELHYKYDEIVSGPICKNWDEVYDNLNLLAEGKLEYEKSTEIFKNKFHKYQDGNSSKRVFEEIKQRYL